MGVISVSGLLAALVAGTVFVTVSRAAEAPDAGRVLETIGPAPASPARPAAALPEEEPARPALLAPDDLRIPVRNFRIRGARAFPESDLAELVREGVGKALTLAELNALARRITTHYRSQGYLLARAYIPAQDINDGIVEIMVLEGRLGRIRLENQSPITHSALRNYLSNLAEGRAVEGASLERQLLLLGDLPGVEVRSTLRPGVSVGTTDLDVKATGTGRVSGSVDADTYGNRFTGEPRTGATMNVNSPAGWGDLLSLRGIYAGSGMDYSRIAWQTPMGGSGMKLGVAWSSMNYRLGKDFAPLQAHGSAEIGTLWLAYPFLRSIGSNLSWLLAHDRKKLEDRVDSTLSVSSKKVDLWMLGISGDRRDGIGVRGITSYSASLVWGVLVLDPATAALDQGAGGRRTDGGYVKLTYNIARLQTLGDSLALYGTLAGQVAGKNLDSSEKFFLGGPYGVRAHPQGEAAGDDGWLATVEMRWTLPRLPDLQLVAFMDWGGARVNHDPLTTDARNIRHLAGEGLGMRWTKFGEFAVQAYLAWRSGSSPTADVDHRPRAWLQAVKYF